MKLLSEEKLEEKIPKDLANVYIDGDSKRVRRSINNNRIDFDKSSYDPIDPDTAFKMWKSGD